MTHNRRPAGVGILAPAFIPVQADSLREPNHCGGCVHFVVSNHYPDSPRYYCLSDQTKTEEPAFRRSWLSGPEDDACAFYLPVSDVAGIQFRNCGLSMAKRFLSQPDDFIDVKTAVYILRKSKAWVYALVDAGKLDHFRVGGTIYIFRPAILTFLSSQETT